MSKSGSEGPADAWLSLFPKTLAYVAQVAKTNLQGHPNAAAEVRAAIRIISGLFFAQERVDPGITRSIEEALTLPRFWTESEFVDGTPVERTVVNGFFLTNKYSDYAFLLYATATVERRPTYLTPKQMAAIAGSRVDISRAALDEVVDAEDEVIHAQRIRSRADAVHAAVKNLPGISKDYMEHELTRHAMGVSQAEKARSLGIAKSTYNDRVDRALKLLEDELTLQGYRHSESA
jgi:hypothetical protein